MIEVTCRFDESEPVLAFAGEIRNESLPALRSCLDAVLDGGHRTLTIDLAQVTAIDPDARQLLAGVAGELAAAGGRARVVGHDHLGAAVAPSIDPDVDDETGAGSPPDTGTLRLEALRDEIERLRRAMASRAVIEQAKGIMMATAGCDQDQAFRILVQQSQHQNRKLRDVAAELVELQERRQATSA